MTTLDTWQPKSRRGKSPNDDQQALQQAKQHVRQRQYDQALAIYESLCERKLPKAFIGVGKIYLRQRRWQPALQAFETAIQHAPTLARAHVGLGETQRFMGDLAAAEKSFHTAISLAPQQALKSWQGLSRVYQRQQQPDATVNALKNALALNPGAMALRRQLALNLMRQQKLDEAAEVLDKGLRYEPLEGVMVALRVKVARQQQSHEVADRLLTATLQQVNDSSDPKIRLNLARALARIGEVSAVDTLLAPLLTGKRASQAQWIRIDVRLQAQAASEVQAIWQQLPRTAQQRPQGQRRQAAYLHLMGHADEAIEVLMACLQRVAGDSSFTDTPTLRTLDRRLKRALKRQRRTRR